MSSSTLALLLLAAFLVALLHAVPPDHWVPLAILARTQRWSMRRTWNAAAWAGFGHIAGFWVLGAVLLAPGYGLERPFTHFAKDQDLIPGAFLFATGWGLFFRQTLHGSSHNHPHEQEHEGHSASKRSSPTFLVVGVAASPEGRLSRYSSRRQPWEHRP